MIARRLSAAALVIVALAAAGCGSSSKANTVSAATWVRSYCTALVGFRNSLLSTAQTKGLTSGPLPQRKAQYVSVLGTLAAEVGHTADAVRAAGTPAVQNGKQIADSLTQALSSGQQGFVAAQSQAASIPTTNARAFVAAQNRIAITIRAGLQKMIGSPVNNTKLHAAAVKEPTCRVLTTTP